MQLILTQVLRTQILKTQILNQHQHKTWQESEMKYRQINMSENETSPSQ